MQLPFLTYLLFVCMSVQESVVVQMETASENNFGEEVLSTTGLKKFGCLSGLEGQSIYPLKHLSPCLKILKPRISPVTCPLLETVDISLPTMEGRMNGSPRASGVKVSCSSLCLLRLIGLLTELFPGSGEQRVKFSIR